VGCLRGTVAKSLGVDDGVCGGDCSRDAETRLLGDGVCVCDDGVVDCVCGAARLGDGAARLGDGAARLGDGVDSCCNLGVVVLEVFVAFEADELDVAGVWLVPGDPWAPPENGGKVLDL